MRLRIAEWPSERAIAFRLWTATLYPVEIVVGQSFGEPQADRAVPIARRQGRRVCRAAESFRRDHLRRRGSVSLEWRRVEDKIYGRFSQFLVYEQVDQGRLRVFFAVRDEAKRVARFDLHPGEVQAMHALARLTLFTCKQVDLLLRDDLSLSVAVNVSCHGLGFRVQTPLWRSEFVISKANDLATLAVFTRRAINQEKTIPIRFGDDGNHIGLRKRNDGQVLAEFHYGESMERIPLSTLQLYELEILAQFALHRAFEPSGFAAGSPLPPETATAA